MFKVFLECLRMFEVRKSSHLPHFGSSVWVHTLGPCEFYAEDPAQLCTANVRSLWCQTQKLLLNVSSSACQISQSREPDQPSMLRSFKARISRISCIWLSSSHKHVSRIWCHQMRERKVEVLCNFSSLRIQLRKNRVFLEFQNEIWSPKYSETQNLQNSETDLVSSCFVCPLPGSGCVHTRTSHSEAMASCQGLKVRTCQNCQRIRTLFSKCIETLQYEIIDHLWSS